jgi:hypothetical protein
MTGSGRAGRGRGTDGAAPTGGGLGFAAVDELPGVYEFHHHEWEVDGLGAPTVFRLGVDGGMLPSKSWAVDSCNSFGVRIRCYLRRMPLKFVWFLHQKWWGDCNIV